MAWLDAHKYSMCALWKGYVLSKVHMVIKSGWFKYAVQIFYIFSDFILSDFLWIL